MITTPTNPVIKNHYDVAVVGAGPAGITAAASAADRGASVILIESTNRFGGSVTAAMHRCMCGLYSHKPRNPLDTLNGNAQRQIVESMLQKDPAAIRTRQFGKAWVLEFPATAWEQSLADFAKKPNIDLHMNSRVVAVERNGNHINRLEISQQTPVLRYPEEPDSSPPSTQLQSTKTIKINALIDCTGAGNILQLIGEDAFQKPDETTDRMLAGFAFRVEGFTGDPEILRLQIPYLLAQAVEKKQLLPIARFTVFYPGPKPGEGICKLAIDLNQFTTADAEHLATYIFNYLKKESTAFMSARVAEMSPRILPRDGLRLLGKSTVTESDILTGKKYPENSVHAWWPIEQWNPDTGPTYTYPPDNDHYDIPPTALQSANIQNLYAAGTCLSATKTASASLRASGICLATGHAASRLAL